MSAVRTRRAPAHVRRAHEQWMLATLTWEETAERVTLGYATELAEHARDFPRPLFRDFLAAEYADMRRADVAA